MGNIAQGSSREANIIIYVARGAAKCYVYSLETTPSTNVSGTSTSLLCDIQNSSFTMEKVLVVLLVLVCIYSNIQTYNSHFSTRSWQRIDSFQLKLFSSVVGIITLMLALYIYVHNMALFNGLEI